MMEQIVKKEFNRRKFVSISLFFILVILVLTGILIQIFEHFQEGLTIHFLVAAHVFAGLSFTVLSILHLATNWRALVSYIKNKKPVVSKETVHAFGLSATVLIAGFLFAYFHF